MARMQVQLDDGWSDLSQEETMQICYSVASGMSRFAIQARGTLYIIDLSGAQGATQMNAGTGKTRKLRILDAENSLGLVEQAASPEVLEKEVVRQRELGPQ